MGKANQIRNRRRHLFLLTFFTPEEIYQEKFINGYWLVKQFNKNTSEWQVAIYTPESFKDKQNYLVTQSELSDNDNELPF